MYQGWTLSLSLSASHPNPPLCMQDKDQLLDAFKIFNSGILPKSLLEYFMRTELDGHLTALDSTEKSRLGRNTLNKFLVGTNRFV